MSDIKNEIIPIINNALGYVLKYIRLKIELNNVELNKKI